MVVEMVSPCNKLFSGEASLVQFPGSDGCFTVLEGHANMIASLTKGKIKLVSNEEEFSFEINGGIVEVLNNKLQVLVV